MKRADWTLWVIAGFIAAYDTWAIRTKNETISAAVWRMADSDVGEVVVVGGLSSLAYHLLVQGPKRNPKRSCVDL